MSRPQGIELTAEHVAIIEEALAAKFGTRKRAELARVLGVHEQTIRSLFSGARRPSKSLLDSVCDVLDLAWSMDLVIKKRRKGGGKRPKPEQPEQPKQPKATPTAAAAMITKPATPAKPVPPVEIWRRIASTAKKAPPKFRRKPRP